MKASEIRELTDQELAKALEDNQRELLNLNIKKSTGQLTQTHQIRQIRRDVARIKTELNAR